MCALISDLSSYECYELLCVQLAVMIAVACYACDIKVQFSLFRLFELDSEHAGLCPPHRAHVFVVPSMRCLVRRTCTCVFCFEHAVPCPPHRAHVIFVPSMRCFVRRTCTCGLCSEHAVLCPPHLHMSPLFRACGALSCLLA